MAEWTDKDADKSVTPTSWTDKEANPNQKKLAAFFRRLRRVQVKEIIEAGKADLARRDDEGDANADIKWGQLSQKEFDARLAKELEKATKGTY